MIEIEYGPIFEDKNDCYCDVIGTNILKIRDEIYYFAGILTSIEADHPPEERIKLILNLIKGHGESMKSMLHKIEAYSSSACTVLERLVAQESFKENNNGS